MKKSTLKLSAIGIAMLAASSHSFAEESRADVSASMEMANASVQNDLSSQNISPDSEEARDIGVNPFKGKTTGIEDIERQISQRELEIELAQKEYDLQVKQAELRLLPYKTAQEEIVVSKGLYEAQQASAPKPKVPNITEEDIDNKIKRAAGEILKEKDEIINKLKQKRVAEEKAANTFKLKLVAHDGSNIPFAIISNSNGDHKVVTGSNVEGWEVVTISPDTNRVLIQKGKKKEVISSSALSTIQFQGSTGSEETSGENGDGMPNPDLLPPPSFN